MVDRIGCWILNNAGVIIFVMVTSWIITVGVALELSTEESDIDNTVSYVYIYTDPHTGGQYLTLNNGITPRLDRDGNQIFIDNTEDACEE